MDFSSNYPNQGSYQRRAPPPPRAGHEASGRYREIEFEGRPYQHASAERDEALRYRPSALASGGRESSHETRYVHENEHSSRYHRDTHNGYYQGHRIDSTKERYEERPHQMNFYGGNADYTHDPARPERTTYSYHQEQAPPYLIESETSDAEDDVFWDYHPPKSPLKAPPKSSTLEAPPISPLKAPPPPSDKAQEPSRRQNSRSNRRAPVDRRSSRMPQNHPAPTLATRSYPSTPSRNTTRSSSPLQSTTLTLEVAPGVHVRVRGSVETWQAIERDFFVPCSCICCESTVCVIQDAEFVLCPCCRVVSPVSTMNEGADDTGYEGGVGLGFTLDELHLWQNDIVSSNQRNQHHGYY